MNNLKQIVKWWRIKAFSIKRNRWKRKYPNPKVYQLGGDWGCHISWVLMGMRIYGHLPRRPIPGDILLSSMQSGKIGRYRILDIEYYRDPPDMFSASTYWDGYE